MSGVDPGLAPQRRVLPPVYLLAALVLTVILHHRLPLATSLPRPWNLAGLAPAVLGVVMMAVPAGAFLRSGTGLVPFREATVLVTRGFFRFTRNPMYLGMASLVLGVALLCGSVGSLLPLPGLVWVLHNRFVIAEERFLEAAFGAEYRAYRQRVRRWL